MEKVKNGRMEVRKKWKYGMALLGFRSDTSPCDPLPYTYVNEETGLVVGRTELQRRSEYMACVNQQLHACGQLRGDHPLIRLIQQCLKNLPAARPGIGEVLRLLEEARAGAGDYGWERMQARNQVCVCVLVTRLFSGLI